MYSIVNIIKHWVTKPHCKLDTNILARMGMFAMSIQSSDTMKRLAKELHSAVVERVWFRYLRQRLILSHNYLSYLQMVPPSNSHSTITPKIVVPSKPRDLAIGLLILEGDKYAHLLPDDYITFFKQQSGGKSVKEVFEINRNVAHWVKQAVLRCEDLEARSGVLNFFLHTAKVIDHVDVIHLRELTISFAAML